MVYYQNILGNTIDENDAQVQTYFNEVVAQANATFAENTVITANQPTLANFSCTIY